MVKPIHYKCRECGDPFTSREGFPLPEDARTCLICRMENPDLQAKRDAAISRMLAEKEAK